MLNNVKKNGNLKIHLVSGNRHFEVQGIKILTEKYIFVNHAKSPVRKIENLIVWA